MRLLQLSLVFLIVYSCLADQLQDGNQAQVTFVNFHSEDITLYFKNRQSDGELIEIAVLKTFEMKIDDTYLGHTFVYKYQNGYSEEMLVEDQSQIFGFGPNEFVVICSTTEGDIRMIVLTEMAVIGAARFLELVSSGYYDGSALHRVVPNFLTQFGISPDYEMRTTYRHLTIPDDENLDYHFEVGFLSFAGSGKDSRSTEVFIVMPGASEDQLESFGDNSWETPFGYLIMSDVIDVASKWYSYGDMPPWGEGPDPRLIYEENGYNYLQKEFPELSFIEKCEITSFKFTPMEEYDYNDDEYDDDDDDDAYGEDTEEEEL